MAIADPKRPYPITDYGVVSMGRGNMRIPNPSSRLFFVFVSGPRHKPTPDPKSGVKCSVEILLTL